MTKQDKVPTGSSLVLRSSSCELVMNSAGCLPMSIFLFLLPRELQLCSGIHSSPTQPLPSGEVKTNSTPGTGLIFPQRGAIPLLLLIFGSGMSLEDNLKQLTQGEVCCGATSEVTHSHFLWTLLLTEMTYPTNRLRGPIMWTRAGKWS